MTTAIEAGKAFVSLGVKSSLNKDLAKSKATLRKFAKVASGLLAGVAAGGFALVTKSIVDMADKAKELRRLAGEVNMTTQELQELDYISQQVGLDLEDMVGGVEELRIRLAEAAQDGVGPLADMFEKLGMSADDFIGMGIVQQIALISEELNKLGAEARQFAADEIFGGDGRRLMNVFGMGAEAIIEMAEEARRLGLVFSNETMQGLSAVSDAWLDLELEFQSVAGNMASEYASELEFMVAFTRLIIRDIAGVWDTVVAQMTGAWASMWSSVLESIGMGDTFLGQMMDNLQQDAERKSEDYGSQMADLIVQQRERREAREKQAEAKAKAKKAEKARESQSGTTVPTPDEMNKAENDTFSSSIPDAPQKNGDEDKFGVFNLASSSVGSFVGGAGVGQGAMITVQENQLQEAKKTNQYLENINRMANMNQASGPMTFTGGQ